MPRMGVWRRDDAQKARQLAECLLSAQHRAAVVAVLDNTCSITYDIGQSGSRGGAFSYLVQLVLYLNDSAVGFQSR